MVKLGVGLSDFSLEYFCAVGSKAHSLVTPTECFLQHIILKIHSYFSVWISWWKGKGWHDISISPYRAAQEAYAPESPLLFTPMSVYFAIIPLKIWCPQINYIDSITPQKVYGKCCLYPRTCFLVCGIRFALGVQSNPGSSTQPLSELQKCHDHQAHMPLNVNCSPNMVFMWLLAAVLDTEIAHIDHHRTLLNRDIT